MRKFFFPTLVVCLFFLSPGQAQQNNDPVLFSIAGSPVHLSEFQYIYNKTNGTGANYSRASVEEYLDLYVKFKLKVKRARDMQLDTIQQLKVELAGYRKQLADSYLVDKVVTERLLREAYERATQDLDISHILVAVRRDAPAADTLAAYQKIQELKKKLEAGADFGKVAHEYSDDQSAKRNDGRIGYIAVPYPNTFYPLETLAYSLPVGELSNPVRTGAGYHLIKVNQKRPARGEMEVAHILMRADEKNPNAPKSKIDSAYQRLQAGANFELLATEVSEDKNSSPRGGYIGFISINQYSRDFEDAAFSITADGQYTPPVQTVAGWHIIKRITKRGIQPYEQEKGRLEAKIKKDTRFEEAKVALIENIKKEAGFKEVPGAFDNYTAKLGEDFKTFKWRADDNDLDQTLFTLHGNQQKTTGDFGHYLERSMRKRQQMAGEMTPAAIAKALYEEYVNEICMEFEDARLEQKYPDFKALMREYEEGILLFEATKMLVWDKASQDTLGLQQFFEQVKQNYQWEERAETSIYRIDITAKDQAQEIWNYSKTHNPDETLAHFNTAEKSVVSVEERVHEKNKSDALKAMSWVAASLSPVMEHTSRKYFTYNKIEKILPAGQKTLQEARGYVVADYQDYLEGKWVATLREEYPVDINQKVLEGIIVK